MTRHEITLVLVKFLNYANTTKNNDTYNSDAIFVCYNL